jgi:hypothetical protein
VGQFLDFRLTAKNNGVLTRPVMPPKMADNLWWQPLDGSSGKQITDFKSERINDVQWSFDGSKLSVIRSHTDSDVVLIRDSRL